MSEPSKNAIQTYSGLWVDVFFPDPETIAIEDIAHSLSILPRFGGHTAFHWSVASHSVNVARLCPQEDRLWGLLHDASEAYMLDLPRPIKYHPSFAEYREIQDWVMVVILKKFGLPLETPPSVKKADNTMLFAEAHALFRNGYRNWPSVWQKPVTDEEIYAISRRVIKHDPSEAENCFLRMFYDLTGGSR